MNPVLSNGPKVVVVGAGIAGLTTAYRLQQGGIDVELYEARGRPGGRIFTVKAGGHLAELGGQNISDGGEAVHLRRFIKEFDLRCVSSGVRLRQSYFNGKDLIPTDEIIQSKKIDSATLREELDKLASTHLNLQEILETIATPKDSLYKILSVRLAAYEGGPIEKLSPLYVETLFHMLLGGICSVHQGNPNGDADVDLITVEGGNDRLPHKMGESLGSKLHLQMPLIKVAKTKNGGFQLTFKNGTEVETDLLVLAIPCSVYRQITFESGVIPPETLEAFEQVQYGENGKIMVPFPVVPTRTEGLIGDEIVAFFDRVQRMLTLYYTGAGGVFSSETIATSYRKARPMIERGFEDCPPFRIPEYARDEANVSYDGPVGYSWPSDPYAQGSYSYIASGQETLLTSTVEENGEIFKKLFAPIDGKLYFVGEHTSVLFDVPGTMEAACESGERIARTILQKIP